MRVVCLGIQEIFLLCHMIRLNVTTKTSLLKITFNGDFPNILGENLIDTSSDVHEISQLNALARSSPFKKEDVEARPLSGIYSSNTNEEFLCSDFVRNNNLSLHILDYGGTLPGYLSTPPDMPIWRTMEDISTPTMPMDGDYGDKDQGLLCVDDH